MAGATGSTLLSLAVFHGAINGPVSRPNSAPPPRTNPPRQLLNSLLSFKWLSGLSGRGQLPSASPEFRPSLYNAPVPTHHVNLSTVCYPSSGSLAVLQGVVNGPACRPNPAHPPVLTHHVNFPIVCYPLDGSLAVFQGAVNGPVCRPNSATPRTTLPY